MGGEGDDVVLALLALPEQGVVGCARRGVCSASAMPASLVGLVGSSVAAACPVCQHEATVSATETEAKA